MLYISTNEWVLRTPFVVWNIPFSCFLQLLPLFSLFCHSLLQIRVKKVRKHKTGKCCAGSHPNGGLGHCENYKKKYFSSIFRSFSLFFYFCFPHFLRQKVVKSLKQEGKWQKVWKIDISNSEWGYSTHLLVYTHSSISTMQDSPTYHISLSHRSSRGEAWSVSCTPEPSSNSKVV